MTDNSEKCTEKKSFDQFDKLNRKSFSIALTNAIKFDYPIQDGSFVLSLNAKFGSGKSTFLEMWQKDLKEQGSTVVQINAWESDFADNPFYPILASLNSVVIKDKKLTKCLRVAATITSHVVNRQIEKLTNINVKELSNNIGELDIIGKSILEAYTKEIECYESLKSSLKKYIVNQKNGPIFILIDELDRARPDYAVRFLEIIKHFFSIKGLIFVIAIDKEHLFSSIKHIYGQDIDVNGYFLRFITRQADLIEPTRNEIATFVRSILADVRNRDFMANFVADGDVTQSIAYFVIMFDLSLREIEYLFRVISSLIFTTKNESINLRFIDIAVFFICTLMKDKEMYFKIIRDKMKVSEMYDYFIAKDHPDNFNLREALAANCIVAMLNNKKSKEIQEYLKSKEGSMIGKLINDQFRTDQVSRIESTFQYLHQKMHNWMSIFSDG